MASLLPAIFCAALGFFCCWALIPLIRRWALKREKSSLASPFHHTHKSAVPRFGGAGLAAAFVVVALAALVLVPAGTTSTQTRWVIILSSLAMFGLGLWDDLRPLGAKMKLLGQLLISAAVYVGGIQIEVFRNPFSNTEYVLGVFGFLTTVLWLVTLTNLMNLIDGIDGLAGGIAFMLMCLLVSVGLSFDLRFSTLLAVGVAGALLGFLYFNFPPAKIYLGDGGAYFLGFLIGLLSIVNSHKGSVAAALIAPVFALALPIVDVILAILRRGLKGLPIFRPDRKHIHHRLIEIGLSRERTVLVLYTISFCCLFVAFGVFWLQGRLLPLLCGFLFLILAVAARSLGFIQDWLAFGSRLGKSLALRHETRYALTLSQWLEMEAERRQCVFELWQDYQFVVKKLGFSEVKLALPDGVHVWRAGALEKGLGELRCTRHEISGGTSIEFAAYENVLPEKLFELVAELAAESWQKAALRWQELHQAPVHFESVSSDTSHLQRKIKRIYEPVKSAWWIPRPALNAPAN